MQRETTLGLSIRIRDKNFIAIYRNWLPFGVIHNTYLNFTWTMIFVSVFAAKIYICKKIQFVTAIINCIYTYFDFKKLYTKVMLQANELHLIFLLYFRLKTPILLSIIKVNTKSSFEEKIHSLTRQIIAGNFRFSVFFSRR